MSVVIIGAGWAGAAAARSLSGSGAHSITVLEARDRVGGRARTLGKAQGMPEPLDFGCSFIHGYYQGNPATQIAKDLDVAVQVLPPPPQRGNEVITSNGTALTPEQAQPLRKNVAAAQAFFKSHAKEQRPASNVSLASGILSSSSPLFEGLNSEQAKQATALLRFFEGPFGAPLEKISLRWFGWEDNYAGSDAAIVEGFQTFVDKTLKASHVDLKLNTVVSGITKTDNGVEISTRDGKTIKADYVICTIPLGVLKTYPDSFFKPALPSPLQRTIADTHVGFLEKLFLVYDKAWWKDVASFTVLPDGKNDKSEDSVDVFTLQVATSAPSGQPTLMIYLPPTLALALSNSSTPHEVIAKNVHNRLAKLLPKSSEPTTPKNSTYSAWIDDEFARGATTTSSLLANNDEVRGPLNFVELGKPLWQDRLCFAGEHTEPNHRGSVGGAVESGIREAQRVQRRLAETTKL